MSVIALHGPGRYRAWAVPAVVAAAVAGGGWLAAGGPASGHPNLPSLTPAQLLAKVETAGPPVLSGTVSEVARLGLPDLPGADQSASLSWTSLISGSHTAKVWLDGAGKQRLAMLGTLSEAEVVHNGRDVWTYTSTSNQVSHTVLPATAGNRTEHHSKIDSRTPIGAADALLKAIDPSTTVSLGPTQLVAGHASYTLVLRPRDSGSTIREVAIAVDGTKFLPLQVQVFGAATRPALQIGFSKVSFSTPKASVFDYRAPKGAAVVTNPLREHNRHWTGTRKGTPNQPSTARAHAGVEPKLIGTGWTTVVEFPNGLPGGLTGGLLQRLTSPSGSAGQRVLTTALVNGVLLPDGRVFLGAVTPSVLHHIAATTPR